MLDCFNFCVILTHGDLQLVECEPQDLKGKGPVTDKDQDEEDDDKVMGDYWSPKLEGCVPASLSVLM